jgi:hypothetical protein
LRVPQIREPISEAETEGSQTNVAAQEQETARDATNELSPRSGSNVSTMDVDPFPNMGFLAVPHHGLFVVSMVLPHHGVLPHQAGNASAMVGTQESSAGLSVTDKRQSRINAHREAVNLLHDFACRLAREFGVTDASAKAQLAIINRTASDCMAAQKAGQRTR